MQTSYDPNMPIGVNGQLADSGPNDILTYNNPTEEIPFGHALEKISGDANGVALPNDGSANIVGFSLRDVTLEESQYPVKSAVAVLRKGRILVEVEEAVSPDSTPHYRYATKQQVLVLDFSADFVTGNSITLNVNRIENGEIVSTSAVGPVPFNTTHAQTAADLDTAISAVDGVNGVTVSGNDLTITADTDVEFSITDVEVTGGASQATATVSETTAARKSSDLGAIRASTDSSSAAALTGAKFLTAAAAGGLAVLDVNLP